MTFMECSSKVLFLILAFQVVSCGSANQKRKVFDTGRVLGRAELNIQIALESKELCDAIDGLAPSQVFHNLSQFYGFAYNFGMPGNSQWELSDAWGRPIRFSIDREIVHIWSLGPDGVDQLGKGDDISKRFVRPVIKD